MRTPKNLHEYLTAELAAAALEHLAANIRAHAESRPMVRWSINLHYWNQRWTTNDPGTDHIVMSVSYSTKPQ